MSIKTLEGLRDFINSNEDWEIEANGIIFQNGWKDNTGREYGICEDTNGRILEFDSNMEAYIK